MTTVKATNVRPIVQTMEGKTNTAYDNTEYIYVNGDNTAKVSAYTNSGRICATVFWVNSDGTSWVTRYEYDMKSYVGKMLLEDWQLKNHNLAESVYDWVV